MSTNGSVLVSGEARGSKNAPISRRWSAGSTRRSSSRALPKRCADRRRRSRVPGSALAAHFRSSSSRGLVLSSFPLGAGPPRYGHPRGASRSAFPLVVVAWSCLVRLPPWCGATTLWPPSRASRSAFPLVVVAWSCLVRLAQIRGATTFRHPRGASCSAFPLVVVAWSCLVRLPRWRRPSRYGRHHSSPRCVRSSRRAPPLRSAQRRRACQACASGGRLARRGEGFVSEDRRSALRYRSLGAVPSTPNLARSGAAWTRRGIPRGGGGSARRPEIVPSRTESPARGKRALLRGARKPSGRLPSFPARRPGFQPDGQARGDGLPSSVSPWPSLRARRGRLPR